MLKYTNYKKIKVTSSFGILETIYQNGGYLMLFGKRQLERSEISNE